LGRMQLTGLQSVTNDHTCIAADGTDESAFASSLAVMICQ
jgi:hypothetical protein